MLMALNKCGPNKLNLRTRDFRVLGGNAEDRATDKISDVQVTQHV